jgi:hypothetical protein
MPKETPKIICLTPVRNEAWVLRTFLAATSLWADVILVANHQSEDDSRAIAASFPKVRIIEDPSREFNEAERRSMLVAAAREIPGPRILVALDADEFLSSEFFEELPQWRREGLPPDTVMGFPRLNLLPGLREAVREPAPVWALYADAGAPFDARPIHGPRIPLPDERLPRRVAPRTVMLHFADINPARNQSKMRWYQCFERLRYPRKRASAIFRLYHGRNREMETIAREPAQDAWFRAYAEHGVDLRAVTTGAGPWWWDRKVLEWFNEYGEERFAKLDIWDVDWNAIAQSQGVKPRRGRFADPRGAFTRAMHRWLRNSLDQPKRLDRVLLRGLVRPFGW